MMHKPLKGIFPFRGFFLGSVVLALVMPGWRAHAQAAPPATLVALAVDNRLTIMVGKYDAGHWTQSTDFYALPQPGDHFTLYGLQGCLADVVIVEPQRTVFDGTFVNWKVDVSSWNNRETTMALALSVPRLADTPEEPLALDNPDYRGVVSRYLKSRGLREETPLLTQAYGIPLADPDQREIILVAQSDRHLWTDDQPAVVYAVALLDWSDHGKEKVFPLVSQVSYKPAGRAIDEHERYYGTRDDLRFLSAVDIDGDGWKEIAVYRAKADGTQVDLFSFNGHRPLKVLSTYKPGYN